MADVVLTEGVQAIPQDNNTGRLWGHTRRQQYTNRGFTVASTTPFSALAPAGYGILVWDAKLAYAAAPTATPAGELDLTADVSGLVLTIANNGSGQTLSGIVLKDYDLLPTSGLIVPGQSYLTATNVATGASVTLSALALASGSAIRLFVPIANGSLRQFYVEPTYGAAVTIGTGSLEVMATPTVDQIALKGSYATTGQTFPATVVPIGGRDANGNAAAPNILNTFGTDGIGAQASLAVAAFGAGFNGATWDRIRVSNGVAHPVSANNTTSIIWSPASGKRFRLLSLLFASSGTSEITIADGGTNILIITPTAGQAYNWALPTNGILSAAANNTLTINSVVSSLIQAVAVGTEE